MKTAFEKFAPAILRVCHRDKEACWAAVMAPLNSSQEQLPGISSRRLLMGLRCKISPDTNNIEWSGRHGTKPEH